MTRRRRAFSLRLALVVIVLATTLATSGCGNGEKTTPPAASQVTAPAPAAAGPAAEFVNNRLRREIASDGLTVDRARQLFALEATSLPGVSVPPGPVQPTSSGTYALTQLLAMRDQLTPAQRARLDELMDANRSVFPPGMPPIDAAFQRPNFELSRARTAVYRPEARAPRLLPVAFAPTESTEEAYRTYFMGLFRWANEAVSTLTGAAKIPGFVIAFEDLTGPDWALSGPWKDGLRRTATIGGKSVNVCFSRIDLRKFLGNPIEVHLSVVVHEVVHCYQQDAAASGDQAYYTAGWITDGEATWAQMVIVPEAVAESLRRHWEEYLTRPLDHLFARKYDAAGFFGHVADVAGTDTVAKRLIPTYVAGGFGKNEAAFNTLVAGREDKVLDTWAPSYFLAHESEFLWTAKGPGRVNFPSDKATPDGLKVGPGETIDLTFAAPWELRLVKLDSSADVVSVVSGRGHMALIDRSEKVKETPAPFEPIALCLRGDCSCPPDTVGQIPPTKSASATIDIGLTGGKTGAFGWAHGESIADYCDPKKPKDWFRRPPPPLATGGSPSGAEPGQGKMMTDPHIVTLDGRWYDLQATGEFVLARSTVDDFAVQVRLGTVGALRTVSVATSLATKVGAERVTVSVDPASTSQLLVLRINGAVATQDFVPLKEGSVRAVFNQAGTGYVIEFADGTRVGASPFVRQGLNAWVVPSPSRRGKLTGLLGDNDGNAANEPIVRTTSAVLSATPGYDELYDQFANSWRVTAAESLLDYAPGQSTATFTDLRFPDRDAPATDAAALAAAEAACKDGGIADVNLLRNCTRDVAATGNRGYVGSYRPHQHRLELATQLSALRGRGVVTTTAATGRTKSVVLEGRVSDATADAFASFQGFKGDIIYLDPDNCAKPRFMQMLGPDGKQFGGNSPQCGQRFLLPADGGYRLSLNPFRDFAGTYRVAVAAVRPDRVTAVRPGEALVGSLENRAEQDVFLVEMKSPGTVTIGGDGCTASFDVSVYYGNDELITAGPACRMGTITLPKVGTYRIVLNPFTNATGAYRIPTK